MRFCPFENSGIRFSISTSKLLFIDFSAPPTHCDFIQFNYIPQTAFCQVILHVFSRSYSFLHCFPELKIILTHILRPCHKAAPTYVIASPRLSAVLLCRIFPLCQFGQIGQKATFTSSFFLLLKFDIYYLQTNANVLLFYQNRIN